MKDPLWDMWLELQIFSVPIHERELYYQLF